MKHHALQGKCLIGQLRLRRKHLFACDDLRLLHLHESGTDLPWIVPKQMKRFDNLLAREVLPLDLANNLVPKWVESKDGGAWHKVKELGTGGFKWVKLPQPVWSCLGREAGRTHWPTSGWSHFW